MASSVINSFSEYSKRNHIVPGNASLNDSAKFHRKGFTQEFIKTFNVRSRLFVGITLFDVKVHVQGSVNNDAPDIVVFQTGCSDIS